MMFLRVASAALGLLLAVLAGAANATPQSYNYALDFISGPLNGQQIAGNLSVDGNDCPLGVCVGNFDPTNVAKTLLSLNITVGGVPFAMNNDTGFGFGPFPDVTFDAAGHLSQIDYQGATTFGGLPYVLDMTGVNIGVDLAAFYQGVLGSPTSLVSLAVVRLAPEPETLPLVGMALVGFVIGLRRKASASV